MRTERARWVTFLRPGTLFAESERRRVDRDATAQDALALALPHEFAFTMEDEITRTEVIDGHTLTNREVVPLGGVYYIDAEVLDARQVEALAGVSSGGERTRRLLRNMRSNGWSRVVRCRTGNWQPFDPRRDEVLHTPAT